MERAEQKHLDAQAQYVALEHEMEAALTDTAHDYAIERFPIEEEPIKAKKKDISVELFTLLWVPYWLLPSGERLLAVDG